MSTPSSPNTLSNEDRIADLEVQLAHQAHTIDELHEMVKQQWAEIDKLIRTATLLADHMRSAGDSSSKTSPGDEPPPPHY
ncbi:MAG: SlyX family protein [Parvibaculum sp.]